MAYFTYNGRQVYYHETGNGEPLMLLHGNTASSKMFDLVVELYKPYFRVILIDFLGHGRSDRLDSFPTDLWFEEAQQTAAFIKQSPYGKVSLLGSSGGAIVALNVGLEHPELVGKIIADSFEGETPLPEFAANVRKDRAQSKKDENAVLFYRYNNGDEWEGVVDNDTDAIDRHYRTIGRFFHQPLNELQAPILLTGSEKDEFVTPGFYEKTYGGLAAKMLDARIHIFPGGGHPSVIWNAEEFSKVAIDFLE